MFGKKKDNLSGYIDTTSDFSNRELRFGVWWVRHRALLKKIGIGMLIAWSAVSLTGSTIYWVYYLSVGMQQDQLMGRRQVAEIENYAAIQPMYAARNIVVQNPRAFQVSDGHYNLVADVLNPNERWVATIRYRFAFGAGQTDVQETTLMPGERRVLAVFGEALPTFPNGARVELVHVVWRHVSAHTYPNVAQYIDERTQFAIDNIDFKRANAAEEIPTHRVSFDLYNQSAYSYWEPEFYVDLIAGGQRTGVMRFTVDQFRAGDMESIDLRSFAPNLRVDNVRLYPVVNVFDAGAFMDPEV